MIRSYLQKTTSVSPLVVFRILLGSLLFISIVRFWLKGWIKTLYIDPKHFFPFYGFEFVQPIGESTYLIFILCAAAALMVAIGLFYRAAIITLFLSFTYIELMDKSTYLNHYYFISMVCLLMIFLPAHAYFSFDARRDTTLAGNQVPRWCVDVIKWFVCLVYLYAGLAKLNSDWLFHAQPLRIWLPSKNDLPLIGFLFNKVGTAYLFCWAGCLYDLFIPFLLMNRRTRPYAYIAVIFFHVFTAILFPIGMFPYIMICTALIFFSSSFHDTIVARLIKILKWKPSTVISSEVHIYSSRARPYVLSAITLFFVVQLLLPLRYLAYPDELFWSEEGYRFSWRVMLMEKAGYAEFTIKDANGKRIAVDNKEFLTPLQEKMMAAQPDMILQYAHILKEHYVKQGFQQPEIYVDSYVALNGRAGKPLIDPATNLALVNESFHHKPWIVPFNNEIKGF